MTPMGHCLCGLTIATLAVPKDLPVRTMCLLGGAFILFANAPDLPFPGWGHDRYEISHSLVVTLALVLIGLCLIGLLDRKRKLNRLVIVGLIAAWCSHMILDSTYNHGHGLCVLWPLSNWHLAMPLPWFETLQSPVDYLAPHSLNVMAIELFAYGSLLVVALVFRSLILAKDRR